MGPVRQNPIQRTVSLFICVCIALCTIVHTILHITDLIVFPLTLQTITTARMMSIWGKGGELSAANHLWILRIVVLSACDVGVLWQNGWMGQDATWYGGRPRLRPHCIRSGPSPLPQKGHSSPHFSAHAYCGQTVALLSNCWSLVKLMVWYKCVH